MSVISNNSLKCTVALAALQNVVDPELGLNVVDLGLIYEIDFDEEHLNVNCTMTLTTQFCPMGEYITNATKSTLHEVFAGYAIFIHLVFNPAWSHQLISEEGKQFLNR